MGDRCQADIDKIKTHTHTHITYEAGAWQDWNISNGETEKDSLLEIVIKSGG